MRNEACECMASHYLHDFMKNSRIISAIFVSICIVLGIEAGLAQQQRNSQMHVYIGTYTRGDSDGIYVFSMNPKNGKLRKRKLAAETENPSFLAIAPNGKYLFAANENSEWKGAKGTGGVTAFRIDQKSGLLHPINDQPSAGGLLATSSLMARETTFWWQTIRAAMPASFRFVKTDR